MEEMVTIRIEIKLYKSEYKDNIEDINDCILVLSQISDEFRHTVTEE